MGCGEAGGIAQAPAGEAGGIGGDRFDRRGDDVGPEVDGIACRKGGQKLGGEMGVGIGGAVELVDGGHGAGQPAAQGVRAPAALAQPGAGEERRDKACDTGLHAPPLAESREWSQPLAAPRAWLNDPRPAPSRRGIHR